MPPGCYKFYQKEREEGNLEIVKVGDITFTTDKNAELTVKAAWDKG